VNPNIDLTKNNYTPEHRQDRYQQNGNDYSKDATIHLSYNNQDQDDFEYNTTKDFTFFYYFLINFPNNKYDNILALVGSFRIR
jgi:hypothetical protein